MKSLCLIPFLILFTLQGKPQATALALKEIPEVCLSETEREIVHLINEYRRAMGLDSVPLSKSLTYVAQVHVKDLAENHPYSRRCNLHSWSDKGPWTPCCYTKDKKQASCMWFKPRELTNYEFEGYEIAFWTNQPRLDPAKFASVSLKAWKKSPAHNNVIINGSEWKRLTWKAMGVGFYQGYSVVWFGEDDDPDTTSLNPCE